jgi:hypothetical protein
MLWHLAQAHCHPDGTPMSPREALKFERDKPTFE